MRIKQEIPNGWNEKHISEIAQINSHKPKDIEINGEIRAIEGDDEVSFLGMEDVSEDAKILKINSSKFSIVESGYTPFMENDVLIAKITPCFENGKGCLAKGLKNNIGFGSTEFHTLRVKKEISPEWLYFFTTSYEFRTRGRLNMQGSAGQKRVPTDFIKVYHLLVPPLPEQQKIAQILTTWDKAIEKLEALIAAKQTRKKALMQQLLTGKVRFVGFSGEWKEVKLKKVLKEEKLKNKDCVITRVLSISNRHGFVLPEEQFSRQVASNDLSNYKIVRKGQFGYNPSRINVGSFSRLDSYDVGVLSPMYVVFSIDEINLNSDFFFNWMQSHEAKQKILSSTQGTVRDSVGFDALKLFLINLPPIDEQQKIAAVLSAADNEIQIHQNEFAALKLQKKGLMQQLLTGKVRVKL